MNNNSWFLADVEAQKSAKLNVFCFSYAGGNCQSFSQWKMGSRIRVIPILLPGRASRVSEPLIDDMKTLVDEIYAVMSPYLDTPYILFGHSLGSQIAFELTRKFRMANHDLPRHFIASARRGPSTIKRNIEISNMNDAEFINYLTSLKGTPKEVLQNPDLMSMYLPMLKTDFKLAFDYQYTKGPVLNCPLTVFKGEHDETANHEDMLGWQLDFEQPMNLVEFEGGHFFIDEQIQQVAKAVKVIAMNELRNL